MGRPKKITEGNDAVEVRKMSRLIGQLVRFGIVGAICTAVDFVVMIFLREVAGTFYLVASGISFSVSVIINYLLSMRYVFHGKKGSSRVKEFIIFVVLCVIGLGINQVIMWAAVSGFGFSYVFSKVGATGIVMV